MCGEREQRAKNNTAMEPPWVQKLPLKSNQQGTRTQHKKNQTGVWKQSNASRALFFGPPHRTFLSPSGGRSIDNGHWKKLRNWGSSNPAVSISLPLPQLAGPTWHWHCTPSCWCPAGNVAGEETVPLNTKNQQLPPLQVPPQTGIFVSLA